MARQIAGKSGCRESAGAALPMRPATGGGLLWSMVRMRAAAMLGSLATTRHVADAAACGAIPTLVRMLGERGTAYQHSTMQPQPWAD